MTIDDLKSLQRLSKIESSSPAMRENEGSGQPMTAVIQVEVPNYVPAGVFVSTRVNPTLFTGRLSERVLSNLRKDPNVKDITHARPQQFGVERR